MIRDLHPRAAGMTLIVVSLRSRWSRHILPVFMPMESASVSMVADPFRS